MKDTSKKKRGSPEDGEICYEELFGEPALGGDSEEESGLPQETGEPEQKSPYEVGNPSGEPPEPPLLLGASDPAQEACKRLWPVAYRYPSDQMQVMIGVRKALRRAHKAAERAGGLEV